MAYNDIQRLRQQYVFNPVEDISGGGMDMLNYAPRGGGYNPFPIQDEGPPNPFDFGQQPSTGPTFPDNGGIVPITPPKTVTPGSSVNPNDSLQRTIDAINRVYTPENVERDRVRALLDKVPERGAPSFARSLVAAGLSLKAQDPVKTAEAVQYAPYYRDVEAFKTKADPFLKAAELENRGNINERTLAGNVVTSITAADKLAENARQADLKNEQAIARNRINDYKARLGRGWAPILTGTTVKMYNKDTGETIDTGVSTDKMTEEDRILLQNEGRLEAAREQGINAVTRTNAAGGNIFQDPTTGKRYRPDANGNLVEVEGGPAGNIYKPGNTPRPGTAGTKTNTLEDRRIIQDRMKIQFETDPIARQFITKGTNGIYSMKQRPIVGGDKPGLFTGEYTQEDVDAWDRVKQESDPSYKPPTATRGVGPSGTGTPTPGGGGGTGLGPTTPPQGGRGGGSGQPTPQQRTVTKREYSPSRNQTRITYSDGTTQIVAGKQ